MLLRFAWSWCSDLAKLLLWFCDCKIEMNLLHKAGLTFLISGYLLVLICLKLNYDIKYEDSVTLYCRPNNCKSLLSASSFRLVHHSFLVSVSSLYLFTEGSIYGSFRSRTCVAFPAPHYRVALIFHCCCWFTGSSFFWIVCSLKTIF